MNLEFESGDCYIELKDGRKAVIRRMDDDLVWIMMGSQACQDNRLQVTTWEKIDNTYRIIEKIQFITVAQIRRILSIV